MTGADLLVVVPWLLFAASVAAIGVLVARRRPAAGPRAGRLAGRQQQAAERSDGGRIAARPEVLAAGPDAGQGPPEGERPEAGYRRPGAGCGPPGTGDESRPGARPSSASERDQLP